jgi:hypothetical protein
MIDQMFDRDYQHARATLNKQIGAGLNRLARTIADSLRALHRLEWHAPWAANARAPHCP